MSNTNLSTPAGTVWRFKVFTLFQGVPPYNDVNSTQAQTLFAEILALVAAATFPLVQEYEGVLAPIRDLVADSEQMVNHVPLMLQLQNALNDRQTAICAPQLLVNPERLNLQGYGLRDCPSTATTSCSAATTSTSQTIVNLVTTAQNGYFNDAQISTDSTVMVTAGSGRARRFNPNQNKHDPFRMCTELKANMEGPADETLFGINIYVRATCHKTGTCTEQQLSGLPEWRLAQSALLDATIQNVHLSDDGLEIVAYSLNNNTVYVLRNESCSNLRLWQTVETIPLEPDTGVFPDYGICGAMHASENHSHIVVTNKNLTTGVRKVYVLTNSTACEQVNGLLNTSVQRTKHTLVQTISDPLISYNRILVSRDGQTLVLEFGTSSPGVSFVNEVGLLPEAGGTVVENGAQGLYIYHWQPISVGNCTCQYVLRQTINYEPLPTNYDPTQKYMSCTIGRTIQLFFAGGNDNRLIRLVDRDRFVNNDTTGVRVTHNVSPLPDVIPTGWSQRVAESPVLQVFDREEQVVDICGKPVADCRQGIINQEGSNVKRGEFAEFVAAPSVYLQGCESFKNEPYNMLYTHRVNKHIFVTWCSRAKAIHMYVESEVDNEWILVPSSVYPFDFLATTADDSALGFRGYLAFTEDPNCELRSNVCFPLSQTFHGQFVFRTIYTGNGGTPGFYNGNTNAVVDLSNNFYITPEDHFVATQNCTNLPFLSKFPTPKTTAPNPNLKFTRATGPIAELPGVSVPAQIPFPLEFNVWQRWPKTDPRFPKCRTGYFKITPQSPFLRIGCDTTVEFVLTPRFYGFDPMSGQPEPDPNTEPRWIFSRSIAPVYMTLSTVCVSLVCAEKNCRAKRASFPYYYRSNLVSTEVAPCV